MYVLSVEGGKKNREEPVQAFTVAHDNRSLATHVRGKSPILDYCMLQPVFFLPTIEIDESIGCITQSMNHFHVDSMCFFDDDNYNIEIIFSNIFRPFVYFFENENSMTFR